MPLRAFGSLVVATALLRFYGALGHAYDSYKDPHLPSFFQIEARSWSGAFVIWASNMDMAMPVPLTSYGVWWCSFVAGADAKLAIRSGPYNEDVDEGVLPGAGSICLLEVGCTLPCFKCTCSWHL